MFPAPDPISIHKEWACTFRYNRGKGILHIDGTEANGRKGIHRLQRRGWLDKKLNAVWFGGNPVRMYTGQSLLMFLAAVPILDKVSDKPVRSFKDILSGSLGS